MNTEVVIALLVALLLTLAFAGCGGALLRLAGIADDDVEAFRLFPVAVALGFSVFSYLGWIVAWLVTNQSSPAPIWVVVVLAVAAIAIGSRYLIQMLRQFVTRLANWRSPHLVSLFPLAVLSLAMIGLLACNGLAPVKEGDALQGYMFTSRWLAHQGLSHNPYNPLFIYFPLNTEMIYALTFHFGSDLSPKALDVLLGLTLLAGIHEFASRFLSQRLAFLSTLSVALMQEFINNWGVGKLDILVSFTFFSAISLLFWEREDHQFKRLVLTAFLLGTACAQKYTVWILAVPLLYPLTRLWYGAELRRLAKAVTLLGIVVALCLIPHLVKNLLWTGNPIAPLAHTVFPSHNIYLLPMSDAVKMSWSDLPQAPLLVFLEGFDKYGLGKLPLLILLGAPLCLATRIKSRLLTLSLATGGLQMAVWILVRGGEWLVPRFIVIPVILLTIAGTAGLFGLLDQIGQHRTSQTLAWAMSCYLLLVPGLWTHRHWRVSLPFVLGRESRENWQNKVAPARAYQALHQLGPELSARQRLFIGSELYNLPEEKIPFVCHEKEQAEFLRLADDQKLAYLRARGFGFYHHTEDVEPAWTQGLPVFAEYDTGQSGNLRFRIYRLPLAESNSNE